MVIDETNSYIKFTFFKWTYYNFIHVKMFKNCAHSNIYKFYPYLLFSASNIYTFNEYNHVF